jgi:hypothetical protein
MALLSTTSTGQRALALLLLLLVLLVLDQRGAPLESLELEAQGSSNHGLDFASVRSSMSDLDRMEQTGRRSGMRNACDAGTDASACALLSAFKQVSPLSKMTWANSMALRQRLKSVFAEHREEHLQTPSENSFVDRTWLCSLLSSHIDGLHIPHADAEARGIGGRSSTKQRVLEIFIAAQDFRNGVVEWDDWHQLRHHVGSWLYRGGQQRGLTLSDLLRLQLVAKELVLEHDAEIGEFWGQYQDAAFSALVHGLGWEAFLDANDDGVEPEDLWRWIYDFQSSMGNDEHVRSIFSAHTLGHGVFYYTLYRQATLTGSNLTGYSVCTPYRPHSLSLEASATRVAIDICNRARTRRESSGCRDGLAHSRYQYDDRGYSFVTGSKITEVCADFDDWWCYFWYQAYMPMLPWVLRVCGDVEPGPSRTRCISAVAWSRTPVFITVSDDRCPLDVYDHHKRFNMYTHYMKVETFPFHSDVCDGSRNDTFALWCFWLNDASGGGAGGIKACVKSGAQAVSTWFGVTYDYKVQWCATNFLHGKRGRMPLLHRICIDNLKRSLADMTQLDWDRPLDSDLVHMEDAARE